MKQNIFILIIAEFFADVAILYQEWRCQRARKYLLSHDRHFRDQCVGLEIVRRRNILYRQGVSPMDPSIPDRSSIEHELPPMAWPGKTL